MGFSPAPLVLEEVLTKGWLEQALSQGRQPVELDGFRVVQTLGPSALKIRLEADYADGTGQGLPRALCLKGIFDERLTPWLKGGAQQLESFFYERCAPRFGVRVPACFYTGYDPETGNGIIIMEDLVPKGVRFLSALSPYSEAQARQSLGQLARLHAASWNADPRQDPWITSKLEYLAAGPSVTPARLTELMQGERGECLPDDLRDGPRIYAGMAALARRDAHVDRCFVHGDAHAGNVWESAEGTGLVDWQVLQRANWSIDVAYHIGAALDIEERRGSESRLLDHYLDCLGALGAPPPDREAAWRLYREALAYGFLMWGMTQRVEPGITDVFVARLGTAVADHGSYDLLGV